ncbi:MAG: ABC transporter ATP-binding protein [Planctomycetota bacterium]
MSDVVLSVQGLRTHFRTDDGVVPSVDGVSFELRRGKTLCVVGESGCGKSVTAFSLMRLIPMPPGFFAGGSVMFEGRDLLKLPEDEMRKLRGNRLAMIFQEPMTSLNPVFTVGDQIMEAILLHQKLPRREARTKAIEMLRKVGIPSPELRIDDFPHQMSGGMKQRVMIAMALSCEPDVLIADEPTTALDVTIQAQILDLLRDLQQSGNMSILLITHDLAVVSEVADEVVVMYAAKVVERAGVKELFGNPLHPYTQGLLKAIPQLGRRTDRLSEIPGQVPKPQNYPKGCHFAERCPHVVARCREAEPPMVEVRPGHFTACILHEGKK